MRRFAAAVLSFSLASAPISADASPRVAAPVEDTEQLGGSPVLVIVLIAAVLAALIAVVSDDNDAVSP